MLGGHPQFVVYGLAEGEDVGLGGGVVLDVWHWLKGGEAGDQQDTAAAAGDQPLPEVPGQAQVGFGVEAHLL